jgi:flagellin-like protein
MRVPTGRSLSGRDDRPADREEKRGISPVIAVVVLLGVTVVLGLTVGPFVLGTIGNLAEETPDGEFAFLFEQDVDTDRTDSFGTQLSSGDGLMVIQMESDTTLDPANIEVRTAGSGGSLLTDTPDAVYAPGDRLRQGDTIDVAAARGETVQVIWTGTDGDRSTVLASLTVPALGSSVPPGVPSPTLDCEWVEDKTASGTLDVEQGDEFAAGDVVACDSFASVADSTVDITGDLTVVADIDADSVTVGDGSFAEAGDVYGAIESSTTIDLTALTVSDSLTAGGVVTLDTVTAEGGVNATGDVSMDNSTVDGRVVTGEDLTLDNSTVTGDVEVTDTLTCEGDSTIAGEDCATYRTALFDVDITATTWPGVENETFRVEVVAENTRIDSGSRSIELVVDGTTHDTVTVSDLGRDQSELVVLEWTPGPGDAGERTVSVETDKSSRDNLDSRPVDVVENSTGLPTVNEFTTSTGKNSITVDWNVSAGDANLSVVTVELHDAQGDAAGEETWFLDDDTATGSVTFTGLATETHSIKLDVSDRDNDFVREIKRTTPN